MSLSHSCNTHTSASQEDHSATSGFSITATCVSPCSLDRDDDVDSLSNQKAGGREVTLEALLNHEHKLLK